MPIVYKPGEEAIKSFFLRHPSLSTLAALTPDLLNELWSSLDSVIYDNSHSDLDDSEEIRLKGLLLAHVRRKLNVLAPGVESSAVGHSKLIRDSIATREKLKREHKHLQSDRTEVDSTERPGASDTPKKSMELSDGEAPPGRQCDTLPDVGNRVAERLRLSTPDRPPTVQPSIPSTSMEGIRYASEAPAQEEDTPEIQIARLQYNMQCQQQLAAQNSEQLRQQIYLDQELRQQLSRQADLRYEKLTRQCLQVAAQQILPFFQDHGVHPPNQAQQQRAITDYEHVLRPPGQVQQETIPGHEHVSCLPDQMQQQANPDHDHAVSSPGQVQQQSITDHKHVLCLPGQVQQQTFPSHALPQQPSSSDAQPIPYTGFVQHRAVLEPVGAFLPTHHPMAYHQSPAFDFHLDQLPPADPQVPVYDSESSSYEVLDQPVQHLFTPPPEYQIPGFASPDPSSRDVPSSGKSITPHLYGPPHNGQPHEGSQSFGFLGAAESRMTAPVLDTGEMPDRSEPERAVPAPVSATIQSGYTTAPNHNVSAGSVGAKIDSWRASGAEKQSNACREEDSNAREVEALNAYHGGPLIARGEYSLAVPAASASTPRSQQPIGQNSNQALAPMVKQSANSNNDSATTCTGAPAAKSRPSASAIRPVSQDWHPPAPQTEICAPTADIPTLPLTRIRAPAAHGSSPPPGSHKGNAPSSGHGHATALSSSSYRIPHPAMANSVRSLLGLTADLFARGEHLAAITGLGRAIAEISVHAEGIPARTGEGNGGEEGRL